MSRIQVWDVRTDLFTDCYGRLGSGHLGKCNGCSLYDVSLIYPLPLSSSLARLRIASVILDLLESFQLQSSLRVSSGYSMSVHLFGVFQ